MVAVQNIGCCSRQESRWQFVVSANELRLLFLGLYMYSIRSFNDLRGNLCQISISPFCLTNSRHIERPCHNCFHNLPKNIRTEFFETSPEDSLPNLCYKYFYSSYSSGVSDQPFNTTNHFLMCMKKIIHQKIFKNGKKLENYVGNVEMKMLFPTVAKVHSLLAI